MRILSIALVLLLLFSCNSKKETNQKIEQKWSNKKSTDLNKMLAEEEEIQIRLFLAQHQGWKIISTGSGLRYEIYEQGDGAEASSGKIAQVEFKINLLDGTECYKTTDSEYEVFMIDHSEIESGVHEGIKKMRVGDRSRMIIPSHLAHGLVGDFNKIPPLTVILVDIHLIGLEK
jgi:FKBP-type peptidyl-prolyl cis-trans isomerase FkpA